MNFSRDFVPVSRFALSVSLRISSQDDAEVEVIMGSAMASEGLLLQPTQDACREKLYR